MHQGTLIEQLGTCNEAIEMFWTFVACISNKHIFCGKTALKGSFLLSNIQNDYGQKVIHLSLAKMPACIC